MSAMSELALIADEVDRLVGPGMSVEDAVRTRVSNHPTDRFDIDEVMWAYDSLHGSGEKQFPEE